MIANDPIRSINGANVEITVTCTTIKYDIDVTVSGLDISNSIELTTNSQTLDFTDPGMQSFTGIDDGSEYAVLLTTQPTEPNQVCTITGGNSVDNNGYDVSIITNPRSPDQMCSITSGNAMGTIDGLDVVVNFHA